MFYCWHCDYLGGVKKLFLWCLCLILNLTSLKHISLSKIFAVMIKTHFIIQSQSLVQRQLGLLERC